MRKLVRKSSAKLAAAPGTIVYVGSPKSHKVMFKVLDFDAENARDCTASPICFS
ncbi:MAG: hypothetical protein HQL11_02790 [Candidatus Omnitrophica bacterium]|nr:hypothetical protein [Candidatus Omnitrophota bacterium]